MPLKARDSVHLIRLKRKCFTSTNKESLHATNKLPPINSLNATDELKWQVKTLPSDWVPNTKPSNVVTSLLKTRQVQHEETLRMMKGNMAKVNFEVEFDIRLKSESMKQKIEENNEVFKESLKTIELPDDIKTITIEKTTFDNILRVINTSICSSLGEVTELYDFLLQLEKKRSDKFKIILKDAYEKMLSISHRLPYQLQEFFELEILNINQITLSNYRAYQELKTQIMLKLENDRRLWIQSVFERKDDYINRKKVVLREIYGRDSASFDVFCRISMPIFKASMYDKSGNVISNDSIYHISQNLAKFLISIDIDVKIMKILVDSTIKKIYSSNYDEVQNINLDMNNVSSDFNLMDLKDSIQKSFFDSSNMINEFSIDMVEKWEDFKCNIQNEIWENVKMFTSAIHLWDDHFKRIFELQELTLTDMKKLVENNGHSEDVQFCKVHILVDKLRQASSLEELQELMGDIKKCLESVMKIIDTNHQKEIALFNKYKKLAEHDASVFNSEVSMFLDHYPKDEDVDPTLQRGRASRLDISQSVKEDIPITILDFEAMMKSLKNWTFGLRESIAALVETFMSDLSKNADTWINLQCIHLHRKLEIKYLLYQPKFQRIYEYVYKIRLAELKQHEERLEKHKMAIDIEIVKMSEVDQIKQKAVGGIIDEFATQLPEYIKKAEIATSSLGMEGLINLLKNLKLCYVNKLELLKDEMSSTVAETLNGIKIANYYYIKCLKLFNEGGNYSPTEVKQFNLLFTKLSKKIATDVRPIVKQLNQNQLKCFSLLDATEKPVMDKLIQCKDELQFHEYTISEIRNVRAKIKDETYKLQYRYNIMKKLAKHLIKSANENVGSIPYFDEFLQNCEYLKSTIQDTRLLLIHEYPFKFNPQLFKDVCSVTTLNHKTNIEKNAPTAPFNMVLFESVGEGIDYITSVVSVLYQSLTEVQIQARAFYGTRTKFIKDVTIPDIKMYMLELLSKYLYYELQCEEIWLTTSVDYMIIIQDILEFLKEYYIGSIRKCVEKQIKDFKKKCFEFTTKLKMQTLETENSYKDLHNKLKPLHGHPKNTNLLQELETQKRNLNQHVLDLQHEIKTTFEDFQEEADKNLETFKENLMLLKNKLKDNLDGYTSLVADDEAMMQLITNKIKFLDSIISSDYYSIENNAKYNNIIAEINYKLKELKKGLKIISECLLKFSNSMLKVTKIVDDISYISADVRMTNSSDYINIMELIEIYSDQQEHCLQNIQFTEELSTLSKKWNAQWEDDLKNINNLYTVKYNQMKPKHI